MPSCLYEIQDLTPQNENRDGKNGYRLFKEQRIGEFWCEQKKKNSCKRAMRNKIAELGWRGCGKQGTI